MIVRELADAWLVVRQADHARLAAELLRLARIPELAEHPWREALLRAAAEHDNGWWEEDAAPRLDPATGGPLDFRALPDAPRRELWRRGAERYADDDPAVATLVAGHALRLASQARGTEWEAFRAELAARRDEWLEAAAMLPEDAREADRWLAAADALALAVAAGDATLLPTAPWRAELGFDGDTVELRLAPFPYAGATRCFVPARRIPRRRYASAVELGVTLAGAPLRQSLVRLVPGDGAG
ncbi:MAG: DUF3891 family protein [Thermoanaerobaculia bacterium]|nr:DUF3891 family protein [Thermoanaerobaculia bacterium]